MEIEDLPVKYQEQARSKIKAIDGRKSDNRLIPQETDKSRCMGLKKGKYGNIETEVDGIVFDSKKEARRYEQLILLEKLGIISDLQRQVEYELIPTQRDENGKLLEKKCTYKADFVYTEKGKVVVEDVKGMKTGVYRLKKKLMLFIHGIEIKET